MNNSGFNQIQAQEIRALKELKEIQTALHQDPRNDNLIIEEKRAASTYRKLAERHHSFLKQKARLEWMRCGDENTRVFHQAIKARRLQNTVYGITDSNGRWVDSQEQVNDAFLQYYIKLLGIERSSRRRIQDAVIQGGHVVTEEQGQLLMRRVSPEEIKAALFSIPGDKSPGPDGYGFYFFKDSWDNWK